MVAIIDYDAGNIKSVEKAFEYVGADTVITRDPKEIYRADHVVLPGVGAFSDAMKKIEEYGMEAPIKEVINKNIPFMGICLGLQLLFDSSEESEGVGGLGILRGKIVRIPNTDNSLKDLMTNPMFTLFIHIIFRQKIRISLPLRQTIRFALKLPLKKTIYLPASSTRRRVLR